jgi:DNA-binding SARP family transcriptional activator
VQFRILGPLQVAAGDSDEPRVVSAPKLRVLLAVLLWRANQPVPFDELAELVWDGTPPGGAQEAVRALVSRLRRRLDPGAAARIVTRDPGYAIEVCDSELDARWFETLTQQAGLAIRACRWAEAARTAAQALELWRGTPLADVPSQMLRDAWVPRLDQLYLQALEWRIQADLHEGRHEQLIPQLRDLTARDPLREQFHFQLMLALYRCGRQAEALDCYRDARRVLVQELGIEPGPELRRLHELVLAGDAALLAPAGEPGDRHPPGGVTDPGTAASPAPGAEPVVPRQLPSAVTNFAGRAGELAALDGLLDDAGRTARGTVVISAVAGTAGVGKTALAVRWAHQAAERFRHGQLYVNLRGFDPSGVPVTPGEAIRGFLDALGVPAERVPQDPDSRRPCTGASWPASRC